MNKALNSVPTYQQILPPDRERLADWLTSDAWPFHANSTPTRQQVLKRFDEDGFIGPTVQSFWMVLGGEPIGLLMLTDLGDPTVMLDLRLKSTYRGQGLGAAALRWMTETIFSNWPDTKRVEGQTREDNVAMRRLFRKVGYVKEAHYRAAWPTKDGRRLASIAYGMLREDWEQGTQTPVPWDDE